MRIEKSFRGISKRLAIHYLSGLGGTPLDEHGDPVDGAGDSPEHAARVECVTSDAWTVHVDTRQVSVGGSLTLTEVQLVFESDDAASIDGDDADSTDGDGDATLSELVESFSQKALRAGG